MDFNILKRKLFLFLTATFLSLFFLELILQAGSVIKNYKLNQFFLKQNADSKKDIREKDSIKVLCVGDSFTQGVGASEAAYSYPAQLQISLKKKFPSNWKVFNCGKAGTNSSELVAYLPKLLNYYYPRYLCVLIGVNDSWNYNYRGKGDSVEVKEKAFIPWKFCFRSYRLFRMLVKYFGDIKANKTKLASVARTNVFPMEDTQNKRKDVDALLIEGHILYSQGKVNEAGEIFKKAVLEYPDNINAKIQLAYALYEQKMMNGALEYAYLAQKAVINKPFPEHKHLSWLFMYLGKFEAAYSEIEQYKEFFPSDEGEINKALGNFFFETYDYPKAELYFEKAISIMPQDAFILRTLARIYSFNENKLEDAKELLFKAFSIDKNTEQTKLYLGIVASSAGSFPEILKKPSINLQTDPGLYKEFIAISNDFGKRAGGEDILKTNLEKISSICAQHNVVPLFMTYPMQNNINDAIRKSCSEKKYFMFDTESVFNALLKNELAERYFVLDNHLNNLGYKVLADKVAEFLKSRLLN